MSGETVVTVIGNTTKDPELKYTASGVAMVKFTVASTPRTYDKQSGAWRDGETLFLPVTVWRQQAEHVAESVVQGCRVVVQGRLSQRSYEDRDGVKRTVYELEADEVAVSLRSATAKVTKAGGSGSGRQQFEETRRQTSVEARQDPWGSDVPGTRPAAGAWGGDEPPF